MWPVPLLRDWNHDWNHCWNRDWNRHSGTPLFRWTLLCFVKFMKRPSNPVGLMLIVTQHRCGTACKSNCEHWGVFYTLLLRLVVYVVWSFHRRWNNIVSVRHPSLFVFISRLKSEERRLSREIRQLRRGQQTSERRGKWIRLEARIVGMKTQYERGASTLDQYWNAVCYVMHSHWNAAYNCWRHCVFCIKTCVNTTMTRHAIFT